jgi:hypothetical protein
MMPSNIPLSASPRPRRRGPDQAPAQAETPADLLQRQHRQRIGSAGSTTSPRLVENIFCT